MNENIIKIYESIGYHCITIDQGKILYNKIYSFIENKQKVILDFNNIHACTALFLNNALGNLYKKFDHDEIISSISFINLTNNLKRVIDRVMENSCRYHTDLDYKNAVDKVMEKIMKEVSNLD